jgi:hypothetical protein
MKKVSLPGWGRFMAPLVCILFGGVSLLGACASRGQVSPPGGALPAADAGDAAFWDTSPQGGDLVIIGVAAVRVSHKQAVELALEDVSRKAALYRRLEGGIVREEASGGAFGAALGEGSSWLHAGEGPVPLAEEFRYDPQRDVLVRDETVFVRARYTPPFPLTISYHIDRGRSPPAWIAGPPGEISGYRAGVGYASPRMRHKDTIIASYEDAAFSIIKYFSSTVDAKGVLYQGSGLFDFSNTLEARVAAQGVLESFYVLDVWADPSNGAVWTLAVAREGSR